LSAATAATAGLTGCPNPPPNKTTSDPGTDTTEEDTKEVPPVELADCRSQSVVIADFGSLQNVAPETMDLFAAEIETALSQVNDALETDLQFNGIVSANRQLITERFDYEEGSQPRDLTRAVAEALANGRGVGRESVERGMAVVVPYDLPPQQRNAGFLPDRWRTGDVAATHVVNGNRFFFTTLGPTTLMDTAGRYTAGRELEAWKAVGRLFGAVPLDGGYETEQQGDRQVITGITPMATRHVYGRHGGRDHPRASNTQPRFNAAAVEYDPDSGETVQDVGREITLPVRGPDLLSELKTHIPADVEHIYGRPSENSNVERFGRGDDPDRDDSILRDNHVKSYTERALTAMANGLSNAPATFDASRPPAPGTRCGDRCTVLDGAVTDDFEDGKALPAARDGTGTGPAWTRIIDPPVNYTLEQGVTEPEDLTLPAGGTHVFRLEGSYTAGWQKEFPGWSCPWSLRGRFYLRQADGYHQVRVLEQIDRRIVLEAGFDDATEGLKISVPGGQVIQVATLEWEEGRWHDYDLHHDGNGQYEARVWPTDRDRPVAPMAVSAGAVFDGDGRVQLTVDGSPGPTLDYARFRWAPSPRTEDTEAVTGMWPQSFGGPKNRSVVPDSGPTTTPKLAWVVTEADVEPETSFDYIDDFYSPVVAGKFMYVCADPGVVVALSLSDGSVEWTYSDFAGTPLGLAVDNGRVYVSMERLTPDRPVLVALTQEGDHDWEFTTSKRLYVPITHPTAANGFVYFAGFRGTQSPVFAVDGGSGDREWRQVIKIGGQEGVYGVPAVTDEACYVRYTSRIFVFDAYDGPVEWGTTNRIGSSITASAPTATDDWVLFRDSPDDTTRTALFGYALDRPFEARTPEPDWTTDEEVKLYDHMSAPTVQNGCAYVPLESWGLHAINISDGSTAWGGPHQLPDSAPKTFLTDVIATERAIYYGATGGDLYAVDPANGETLFSIDGGVDAGLVGNQNRIQTAVVATNGRLYTAGSQVRAWREP